MSTEVIAGRIVVQVLPTNDYKVYLYFSNGKVKLFDAKELVTKGVFKQLQDINIFKNMCTSKPIVSSLLYKLQDINIFKNMCTVINDTLAWDVSGNFDPANCLDLDPEELYNSCPDVEEPNIFSA